MSYARALIVDDHRALSDNIREVLEEGLEELSLACLQASSAADALALVGGVEDASEAIDLALIDLHLPDASGTELIHRLQEVAPWAQVVIITGDATVQSAIEALHEGAFGYVLKPFDPDALLQTARRAIDRSRLLRERESLRRELERSEQRYRDIIESVPALVLSLTPGGVISLWNRRLEELTGYPREEMLGQPGEHLVGSAGDQRLPIKGDGYSIVRWQRATVPTEDDGQPPATLAVGVDVTEEREMQRRAARAERLAAVGTLAAGLAHEVRNPLNSASLQLQVLDRRVARGEREEDKLRPIISLVHDEIRRLDRLVSDFLAFARPMPLELRHCRLDEILTRVAQLVRPECEAHGITLRLALDAEAARVEADEERLRQVVLNVVRNAIEAMGESGSLTLRTRRAEQPATLAIVVEDTGPGFPEDAPIFDAFYTTKVAGTGLGLAIVHSIVSEHGGSVGVRSGSEGTEFSILLPEAPSYRG